MTKLLIVSLVGLLNFNPAFNVKYFNANKKSIHINYELSKKLTWADYKIYNGNRREAALTATEISYHVTQVGDQMNVTVSCVFDKSKSNVGTGLVGAPECGDVMRLQIEVVDNIIVDAKFKTFGCGSAIASSSVATEWLKGKSLDEAMTIDNMDLVEELNLPPVKIHCSVLAEDAIKSAINDYRVKNGLEPIVFEESHI